MPLTLDIPETPAFNETCSVPLPGEGRTALSVRDAPEKLLENDGYLRDRADTADDDIDALRALVNVIRTNALYRIELTEVGGGGGDYRNLTELYDNSPGGSFSATDGQVTVPAAGKYRVSATMSVKRTADDDAEGTKHLWLGLHLAGILKAKASFSTRIDELAPALYAITLTTPSVVLTISNPETQTIAVRISDYADDDGETGSLVIQRVE